MANELRGARQKVLREIQKEIKHRDAELKKLIKRIRAKTAPKDAWRTIFGLQDQIDGKKVGLRIIDAAAKRGWGKPELQEAIKTLKAEIAVENRRLRALARRLLKALKEGADRRTIRRLSDMYSREINRIEGKKIVLRILQAS